MADPVLQPPTNPHFFKPLLPGFDSFLTIPVKFHSVYLEGRNEGKTVELRSDASEISWKVEMEGRKLTVGWKEFATAHDLQVGDVIVFRHDGALVFHITCFGPSCCEIQYVQTCDHDDNLDDDDQENIRNLSMKQSLKTEPESSIDEDKDYMELKSVSTKDCNKGKRNKSGDSSQKVPSSSSSASEGRFVTLTATPSSLRNSRLHLPKNFVKVNRMKNLGGKKITLLDKHGKEWPVKLVMEKGNTQMRLGLGLKEFFKANGIKAHESLVFEFVWEDKTTLPILQICSNLPCYSELVA
ncbi:PREDICTED: B3 domain-containing protein REM7-like [Camelina sativa]|uniref:B3 domain-containing protein REM7-like n=1 Tax=Camelina sativa TaxID=90675 RepID=A0ABM0WX89_CAMSA|nr:PREDICTED: B3 domain-containing protein REM7-like [Camelina sativa]